MPFQIWCALHVAAASDRLDRFEQAYRRRELARDYREQRCSRRATWWEQAVVDTYALPREMSSLCR